MPRKRTAAALTTYWHRWPSVIARVAVVVYVLLALTAAPAEASWKTERSLATASVVWNGQLERVCPQGVTVAVHAALTGVSGERVPLSEAAAWATPHVCTVNINAARWQELKSYEPRCSVILHETGHIIGLGHTARGIMRGDPVFASSSGRVGVRRFEEWSGTDSRCRDRGRPYLSRHGRL